MRRLRAGDSKQYRIEAAKAFAEALEPLVRGSLAASKVDFEFSPSGWVANCFLFRLDGFSNFTLRVFLHVGDNGGESYVVELQGLRGSQAVFRAA